MFGGWEWIITLIVIALLLFGGSKKIPELARSLGRATGEFRRGQREIEREIKKEFIKGKEEEEDKVIKIAKELGIDIEGKSKEELKKEIAIKLGES